MLFLLSVDAILTSLAKIYAMKYIPDWTFDPALLCFGSQGALQRKSKYTNKRSRVEVIKQIRGVLKPAGAAGPDR